MKNHNNFSDMYREHILELYKNPSNFGEIKNPTYENTGHNSVCGDEITVQINAKDGKVEDIKFNGSGCVISMVSASLLTNEVKGKPLKYSSKLNKDDILDLLKIKVNPARMKCALLPLDTLKGALKKD